MLEHALLRPYQIAGPGKRFAYTMVDAIVFAIIWHFVVERARVRPPFGMMQRYKPADYEAYLTVMSWMTLALFLMSISLHLLFGASLGKILFGYKTVRTDGSRMSFVTCLLRSFGCFLIGLMILAPGPMIAFVFGEGSEISSLVVLLLGVAFWLFVAWLPFGGHIEGATEDAEVTMLERRLGIMTVKSERNRPGTVA